MFKNYTVIILALILHIGTSAQDAQLRKMVMKSDVIVYCKQDSVRTRAKMLNDFSQLVTEEITATDTILKNGTGFRLKGTRLIPLVKDEDYFPFNRGEECLGVGQVFPPNYRPVFYTLYFLKKSGNNYSILAQITNDNTAYFQDLFKKISSLTAIEKTKNERQRYTQTIDWFLEYSITPDNSFIGYYKTKGILKSNELVLNEQQYAKARAKFYNGEAYYLDYVGKTEPEQVRDYYLQKLRDITSQSTYDYSDCLYFKRIVEMLTDNFDQNYNDVYRVMNDLLIKDGLENYEKEPFMKQMIYLIEKRPIAWVN